MAVCSSCGLALTFDEQQSRQCPGCNAPVEDVAAQPRQPRRGDFHRNVVAIHPDDRPAWGTVRTGLGLQAAFWVLLWVSLGAMYAATRMSSVYREQAAQFEALAALAWTATVWATVLLPTGCVLCLAVPRSTGGRPLAVAAVACAALWVFALSAGTSMSKTNNAFVAKQFLNLDDDQPSPVDRNSWRFQPEHWTDDAVWPTGVVSGTLRAAAGFFTLAGLLFAGFVAALSRSLGRRKLWPAAGVLFALPFVALASWFGTDHFVNFADVALRQSWDVDVEGQEFNLAAVLFGLSALAALCLSAAYVWILVSLRSNIAHLMRGERLLNGEVVQ